MKKVNFKLSTNRNTILKLATNFLYSFILATVLFTFILPEVKIFLVIFDAVWLLLLISYGKGENKELLCNAISLTLGILSSYVILKYIKNGWLKNPDAFVVIGIIIGVLEIVMAIVFIAFGYMKTKQLKPERGKVAEGKVEEEKPEGEKATEKKAEEKTEEEKSKQEEIEKKEKNSIFPAHMYDLERIREYVLKVPIVGVNASWGNGKTFVVERLCHELENDYEVIWIDLLTCNLDEIELILTSELEKILTKHRIYSKNSRQLKAMLNNGFLNQVQDFVMGSTVAMSSAFSELKRDIGKIDKKVLIVYDDLDRLTDKKSIQKIFAISEKLSGENIHVLYQYDGDNLSSLGLERQYVEKYIPFTVNLTEMEFEDIVIALWNELDMAESGINQKEILYIPTMLPTNPEVDKLLSPYINVTCQFHGISIRTVRIYLEEAKMMLGNGVYFPSDKVRGTVLRFLFLKNFWNSYYEEFHVWKDVEETLLFKFRGKEYTMSSVLSKIDEGEFKEEDIKRLFKMRHNQEVYFLLRMLDCEFIWKEEKANNNQNADFKSLSNLEKQEKKDRTNHIIWNILANGKSEYTDMKAATDKFKKEVLKPDEDEWEQAWNKYCDNLYQGKLEKGNRTIFKIGDGYFIPLFQGFRLEGATSDEWKNLLEFYYRINRDKSLSPDLAKCLYYCDVHLQPVYLEALRIFCNCEIVGNLNSNEGYWKFLQVYLPQIFYFGYSQERIFEPWNFEWGDLTDKGKTLLIEHIPLMIKTMINEKERFPISKIKEECDLIIEFLQKNRDLMETNSRYLEDTTPRIHLGEVRTELPHQGNYDQLLKLKHNNMTEDEKKNFILKVEESYQAGKLYPFEVRKLLEELDK